MSETRVGVIGLGIMGMAMARNIAKAGYQVAVTTRSASKRDAAAKSGLSVLETPEKVAAVSDMIIIMVTGPSDVEQIIEKIVKTDMHGKIIIQMSTIDEHSTLNFAEACHRAGARFLDCPVTGSKKQVEDAQLILLAGGEADVLEACRPLLLSMGKAIVFAGAVGKGSALKLCMNLIVAQMTTALCESVALANAQNFPAEKIFEVISHSPALNCGYFKIKEKALLSRDFSPAFSLANMLKDVRFMNEAAKARRITLPVTQTVQGLMEKAFHEGHGDEDLISVFKSLEEAHLG